MIILYKSGRSRAGFEVPQQVLQAVVPLTFLSSLLVYINNLYQKVWDERFYFQIDLLEGLELGTREIWKKNLCRFYVGALSGLINGEVHSLCPKNDPIYIDGMDKLSHSTFNIFLINAIISLLTFTVYHH